MRDYRIALLSGDGIGPVMAGEIADLLKLLGSRFEFRCEVETVPFGKTSFQQYGTPLTDEAARSIHAADAALAAAVDAKGVTGPTPVGLLRKKLGLFADIRPIRARAGRWSLRDDLDLVVVREITQGFLADRNLHAGNGEWMSDENTAFSLRVITYGASRRIADHAFCYAEEHGRRKITALHKSSIFQMTCGTFLRACRDAAECHPGILYEEEVVDSTANGLIAHPEQYDILLTTNLLGDIISDEASALVSSLAPSVNLGSDVRVYLPVSHAPAYKELEQDTYDPMPALLCLQMMLNDLGENSAAEAMEQAFAHVLSKAYSNASVLLANFRNLLENSKGGSV